MNRLPVVLCMVALLGSAVSAVLYFRIGDSKKFLEVRLAESSERAVKLEANLAAVNEQNGSLKARIGSLDAELEATKIKFTTSEARVGQLDRDVASVKSVLSVYEQTAQALATEVTFLRQDLADSRASNAAPEAVAAYKNTIAELERQLASARNGAAAPSAAGASTAVFTNRAGRSTVLTIGPESAFVVLNFGSSRGAQIGQKLSVSQGTDVVATVLISDVRANFSVAQVLPETLRGVLQKGDSAVLVR